MSACKSTTSSSTARPAIRKGPGLTRAFARVTHWDHSRGFGFVRLCNDGSVKAFLSIDEVWYGPGPCPEIRKGMVLAVTPRPRRKKDRSARVLDATTTSGGFIRGVWDLSAAGKNAKEVPRKQRRTRRRRQRQHSKGGKKESTGGGEKQQKAPTMAPCVAAPAADEACGDVKMPCPEKMTMADFAMREVLRLQWNKTFARAAPILMPVNVNGGEVSSVLGGPGTLRRSASAA